MYSKATDTVTQLLARMQSQISVPRVVQKPSFFPASTQNPSNRLSLETKLSESHSVDSGAGNCQVARVCIDTPDTNPGETSLTRELTLVADGRRVVVRDDLLTVVKEGSVRAGAVRKERAVSFWRLCECPGSGNTHSHFLVQPVPAT